MSNNGINSATNGRTSANNTHATANTASSSSAAATAAAIQKNFNTHQNSQSTSSNITTNSTISNTLNNTKASSISFKTTALPDKQQPKSNNNEHVNTATATGTISLKQPIANVNINTKIQTHRRDSSSVSGHHNSHTGGIHLPQSLKDASKYRYIKPQTLYKKLDDSYTSRKGNDEVDRVEKRTYPLDDVNNDHCLIYYDDQLIAGSLDALIEHMVPASDYYPERTYIFSFLLSVRLFIRPHELLAKISRTWEQQQQQLLQQQSGTAQDQVDDAGHFTNICATQAGLSTNSPLLQRKPGQIATQTQKSAQNCIRLLAEWIETFPYDFRDERLMQQVRILTRKCVYIDNALGKQVSRILQLLVQRLTALEKYEEFLQSLLQNDLNTIIQPHYSTSASASYSSSSSSTSSSNAAHNSLTKSAVQALNSHDHASSSTQKNHYLINAQFSHNITPTPASYNTSSNIGHSSSDSPNSHDVFGIMDLCPSCAHLAHQLTAIELERLSHIGPEEFVQAFAKEYQNSMSKTASNPSATAQSSDGSGGSNAGGSQQQQVMQTSLNDMKKTRNLESYVEWFNRLSYLTASEIVKVCRKLQNNNSVSRKSYFIYLSFIFFQYPKKKQRVRIIEYWIETARECFNIGNFNSLMAIIAGLNLAPISRLKKTVSLFY